MSVCSFTEGADLQIVVVVVEEDRDHPRGEARDIDVNDVGYDEEEAVCLLLLLFS